LDSDLAESLAAIREVFQQRHAPLKFGKADPALVTALRSKLRLPRRYRDFLLEADPLVFATRTPSECVQLIPCAELEAEQAGYGFDDAGQPLSAGGWRPTWIVIGRSTILGDPYFLDVGSPDPEGDCPVYTAMSGRAAWQARLCASSFALFLRILAVGMEVARGFPEESTDVDDEDVFREAIAPRIRAYDPAALKAGHWT
jgi:hypothetical protein